MKYLREYNTDTDSEEWVGIPASKALSEIKLVLERHRIEYNVNFVGDIQESEIDEDIDEESINELYQINIKFDMDRVKLLKKYSLRIMIIAKWSDEEYVYEGSNVGILMYHPSDTGGANEIFMKNRRDLIQHLSKIINGDRKSVV